MLFVGMIDASLYRAFCSSELADDFFRNLLCGSVALADIAEALLSSSSIACWLFCRAGWGRFSGTSRRFLLDLRRLTVSIAWRTLCRFLQYLSPLAAWCHKKLGVVAVGFLHGFNLASLATSCR